MKIKPIDQAVWNNAVWCDLVCRTHGKPGVFAERFWYCLQKAPPFYPNSVTLNRSVDGSLFAIMQATLDMEISEGWGIKDSFANLELRERGFQPLIDAEWLYLHETKTVPRPDLPTVRWEIVADKTTLTRWEEAWADLPISEFKNQAAQIFQPPLLADERLSIVAAYQDRKIVAGAIGLVTNDVVGVSNLFGPSNHGLDYRAGCITKLQEIYPNRPLVGYEGGDDLIEMEALGFQKLGPLRIWVRDKTPI